MKPRRLVRGLVVVAVTAALTVVVQTIQGTSYLLLTPAELNRVGLVVAALWLLGAVYTEFLAPTFFGRKHNPAFPILFVAVSLAIGLAHSVLYLDWRWRQAQFLSLIAFSIIIVGFLGYVAWRDRTSELEPRNSD